MISAEAGSGTAALRFLWVGSPGMGAVMLHNSSNPDGPVAALSAWRLSPPIMMPGDSIWSVTIADGHQLRVNLPPSDRSSVDGDRAVFLWLHHSELRAASAWLPSARWGGLFLLNLTDLPLDTRCGNWTGLLAPAQLLFRDLPPAGAAEIGLAFATHRDRRVQLLFSTILSVREDDRTLIVIGPTDGSNPIPRRVPVRRLGLQPAGDNPSARIGNPGERRRPIYAVVAMAACHRFHPHTYKNHGKSRHRIGKAGFESEPGRHP